MFRKLASLTYYALLATLSLSISACRNEEVTDPSEPLQPEMIVLQTDSDEWKVQLFKEHLFYSEAVAIELPAPWVLPTRDEAAILRTLTYGDGSERFITSDGYTFGMPSAAVTKAGAKTRYSVLGLWRRRTVIDIPF